MLEFALEICVLWSQKNRSLCWCPEPTPIATVGLGWSFSAGKPEDRVSALRDTEAPAPAQDMLLCSMLLQETFAWRKCVRLHSIWCCISQRFPSTESAFVLQVLGVTAEVSGATAMKYWNWVSERNLFQLSSGSKAGYCGLMNYPVFAEQHVSLHKRWDKATLEKVYFIKV